MSKKIKVKLDEAVRVYRLVTEINYFFHQPLHFDDTHKFSEEHHEEILNVMQCIMQDWLSTSEQKKL